MQVAISIIARISHDPVPEMITKVHCSNNHTDVGFEIGLGGIGNDVVVEDLVSTAVATFNGRSIGVEEVKGKVFGFRIDIVPAPSASCSSTPILIPLLFLPLLEDFLTASTDHSPSTLAALQQAGQAGQ
jgi:hypothetical protein